MGMSVLSNSLWYVVMTPHMMQLHGEEEPQALGTVSSPEHGTAPRLGAAMQAPAQDTLLGACLGVTAQHCLMPWAGFPNHHSNAVVPRLIIHTDTSENLMSLFLPINIHSAMLGNAFETFSSLFLVFDVFKGSNLSTNLSTNFTSFKYRKLH